MKRYILYIGMAMLLAFASCEKDTVQDGEVPLELLALSTDEPLEAVSKGETIEIFAISRYMPTCRVTYSNANDSEWITCYVGAKDSFNVPLKFVVKENKSFEDRTATISVVIRDDNYDVEYCKDIVLTQKAAIPTATDEGEREVPADKYQLSFIIKTNLPSYQIISNKSWVAFNKTTGSNNTSVIATIDANPYASTRTATISIKSNDGTFEVVKIVQKPMVYSWSTEYNGSEVENNELVIDAPWYTQSYTVVINTNMPWKCEQSSTNWYTVNVGSVTDVPVQTKSTKTEFKFTLKENRVADRTQKFTIYSTRDRSYSTTITVRQAYAPSLSFANSSTGTTLLYEAANYSLNVETSAKWSAASDANWLKIKTEKGEGKGAIEYSVEENMAAEPRVANIVVSLDEYPDVEVLYEVTQACDNTIHYTATAKLDLRTSSSCWGDDIVEHEYDEDSKEGYIEFHTAPTKVGSYAFQSSAGLISVQLPKTITLIDGNAFYSCSSLESVNIPDSVTTIGSSAFSGCSALKVVNIPNGITSIGSSLFINCSSLTTVAIPESVTSIGNYAFDQCSALTTISIPESVTSIGISAFRGCTSLISVTIPASVTSIGNGAFVDFTGELIINSKIIETDDTYRASWLGDQLTKLTIGGDVTKIGEYVFLNCVSLTSVTIQNSVQSIGSYAFSNCVSLTSVTIPNSVQSIGSHAFRNCESLTSVTIPNSVQSIGNNAFSNCESLTSVTVPNSVQSIGDYTFSSCDSLTSVIIGYGVTSIGDNAFSFCASLASVTIPNSVTTIGSSAFRSCGSLISVTIPDSVTLIGNSAFYECSKLTSVIISDSVTTIGSSAFYSCSSLKSVTIPNSVTSIGTNAFEGCSALKSMVIGTGVTSIGGCVFSGCTGTLTVNCNIPSSESSYQGAFYDSKFTSVEIGNGVTTIGDYAFYYCRALKSVTIPNSVTSIGISAFRNCSALESMVVGTGVTSIGNSAFYGCTGTLTVNCNIPSVASYTQGAFYESKFTSVEIGNGVTTIGDYAFYYCRALESVTIPNSVTSIGKCAFYACSNYLVNVYCKPTTPPSGGSNMFYSTNGWKIYVPAGSVDSYKSKNYWSSYSNYITAYDF